MDIVTIFATAAVGALGGGISGWLEADWHGDNVIKGTLLGAVIYGAVGGVIGLSGERAYDNVKTEIPTASKTMSISKAVMLHNT